MAEDGSGDGLFEFDCPDCGTHIVGEVERCPNCGVEFDFEDAEEFQCPECGTILPADATVCPNCGTEFEVLVVEVPETPVEETSEPSDTEVVPDEDEMTPETPDTEVVLDEGAEEAPEEGHITLSDPLMGPLVTTPSERGTAESLEEIPFSQFKEEFPRLVEEIKPLLLLINENGIDSQEARVLIDKTVTAAKRKDTAAAITYARDCLGTIERALDDHLEEEGIDLERFSGIAKQLDKDPAPIDQALVDMRSRKGSGDLKGALDAVARGRAAAEEITGRYVQANEECDDLEALIQNAERFYVDVREPRRLLREAREAGDKGDWNTMSILARKGHADVLEALPELVEDQISQSREALLELKVEGKDVSTLIKILKEASLLQQKELWAHALERLVEFKSEVRQL